jgi:6-pyruvoyl-tetrahydropterin synthase
VPPAVWAEFDHRNLSVDIPDLRGHNVVTETIAVLIAQRVPGAARVRLWETDTFYVEFTPATGAYSLGRVFHFSAAHHLFNQSLTGAANTVRYGACAERPHGHDFVMEVVVSAAALDPLTETAFDLGQVDQAAAPLLAELHEADLDHDVAWLAGQVNTPANLAAQLWPRLEKRLGAALTAVGVAATPDEEAWKRRG